MTDAKDPLWEALKKSSTPLEKRKKVTPPAPTKKKESPLASSLSPLEFEDQRANFDDFITNTDLVSKQTPLKRKGPHRKLTRKDYQCLDLHGMTQRDAFAALDRFLRINTSKSERNLLIITGKGSLRADSHNTPDDCVLHLGNSHHLGHIRQHFDDPLFPTPRGILRQEVPKWLDGPFRPLIASYSNAPQTLGGPGALIVRLKSPTKIASRFKA